MNINDFFVEGFELYDTPFSLDGIVYAIPELWNRMDENDECYISNISQHCTSFFNPSFYALKIKNLEFFESINLCEKLTIFYSKPNYLKSDSETDFYRSHLYNKVLENLVFLGWNVISGEGSAFTDGNIYPIYLSISGELHRSTKLTAIETNHFGLIDSLTDCQILCNLNNNHPRNYHPSYPNNKVYWYPSGIYVDKYTYLKIR